MNKIFGWLAGMTAAGKYVKKAQMLLEGKKAMLAGLGTGIAGTLTIIGNFSREDGGGLPYLLHVAATMEFQTAMGGFSVFFLALKGEKIRNENAEILEEIQASPSVSIKP